MIKNSMFGTGFMFSVLLLLLSNNVIAGSWEVLQEYDRERDYFAFCFVSATDGWVVGESPFELDNKGFIGYTTDAGKTWQASDASVPERLQSVYFFDKKHGWVVGDKGLVMNTVDGGKSWDVQTSKVEINDIGLSDVHFTSNSVGYAVGMGETIVHTTNGGGTWKILRGGQEAGGVGDDDTNVFNAVQFIDTSTGWVVGASLSPSTGGQKTLIQKTTDAGKNWVDLPVSGEDILSDVFFVDASIGWVVGENGVILRTSNGGESWERQKSNSPEKLRSVVFISKNTGWAVGGEFGVNVVLQTEDSGQTWIDQSSGKLYVQDIGQFESDVWITGQNGFVKKYSKQHVQVAYVEFSEADGPVKY